MLTLRVCSSQSKATKSTKSITLLKTREDLLLQDYKEFKKEGRKQTIFLSFIRN